MTPVTSLLRSADEAFLNESFRWRAEIESGLTCVTVEKFPLAAGLSPAASDLLVRLPAGFPDAAPDMFWFAERITRVDNRPIPAIDLVEHYVGRDWLRWSRHIGGQWRPGIDDLRSYFGYIRACLAQAAT